MFHLSTSALRRTFAQTFAVLLILAAVGRFGTAHAQVSGPELGTVYSSVSTTPTTITATYIPGNPPRISGGSAWFRWKNPYAEADFTVGVSTTAGVPVDFVQTYFPGVTQESRGPSPNHFISGVAKNGWHYIFVAQSTSGGQSTFRVTLSARQRMPPAVPVPANMCNPIPQVGVLGGASSGPQVITRSNISIGPDEVECYMFGVSSSFTAGRPTSLLISNLPPTGTKTITIVNPNGPYPLGPVSTTAASFGRTVTLMPGQYYLVVSVAHDSISRTNYGWYLQ